MSDAAAKDGRANPAGTSGGSASVPATIPESTEKPSASKDVVLLGPPTTDGAGVHVIRAREERIEAGELRALEEGRPIRGEIVTLQPRQDNPRVCDVKDSYRPPAAIRGHKGPANVTTDAYRDGWDEVFGKPTPKPN
jgi:hypothetical protein